MFIQNTHTQIVEKKNEKNIFVRKYNKNTESQKNLLLFVAA